MNLRLWSMGLILPVLAGCSREPSEVELQQVYQTSLQQANQIARRVTGQQMQIQLKDFKKLQCQPVQRKGAYHCTFEVSLLLPVVGMTRQNGELTVTKSQQQWVVASND